MARVTDQVRKRYRLLAMQRDLAQVEVGLDAATKKKVTDALKVAKSKVKVEDVKHG